MIAEQRQKIGVSNGKIQPNQMSDMRRRYGSDSPCDQERPYPERCQRRMPELWREVWVSHFTNPWLGREKKYGEKIGGVLVELFLGMVVLIGTGTPNSPDFTTITTKYVWVTAYLI